MARITELGDRFKPVWIWDVTDRVGWGMPNQRGDVQLVQLSINKLIDKLRLTDRRKRLNTMGPGLSQFAPLQPLVLDGFFGKETANAISSYLGRVGGFRPSDEIVDPVHPLLQGMRGDPTGAGLLAFQKISRRTMFNLNRDHFLQHGTVLQIKEMPPPLQGEAARA